MRLVASMIVKNEMDRYLPLAVAHLLTFVDEIRVLDDHSSDGTFEWLGGLNKPVLVQLNPDEPFFENEARARNALLRWTMKAKPDYVLSIDADEFVENPTAIRRAMEAKVAAAYTLEMLEVWKATSHTLYLRVDGQWGPRKCPILWRAPAMWDETWSVLDRKLACGREPMPVRRSGFVPTSSGVLHFGWANESRRQERAGRYFEHDKGEFHKNAHLQSILFDDARVSLTARAWPDSLRDLMVPMLKQIHTVYEGA